MEAVEGEAVSGTSGIVPKTEAMEEEEEEPVVAPSLVDNFSFPSVQKCVFCSSTLTSGGGSKLLECLHAVCGPCLANWTEEGNGNLDAPGDSAGSRRECPECRLPAKRSSLVDNKFLDEVPGGGVAVGSSGGGYGGGSEGPTPPQPPACKCPSENPVSDWCETCREFICASCTVAHKQLTCTKDHIIRPKEEGGYSKRRNEKYPCPNHPKEFLVLYCTDCEAMTCRDCQLVYHRDHKYKFLEEIANDVKDEMRELLKDVSYKVEILDSGISVLDERTRRIQEKKQEMCREIKEFVRRTNEIVTKTAKELFGAVNSACASKLKSHEEHRETLAALSAQATHCAQFVDSALNAASDNCLVYTKRTILNHLNRMKSKKSQIPNKDFPISIQLVKCQIDLLELIVQGYMALQVDNQLLPPHTKHKQLNQLLTIAAQKMSQAQQQKAAQAAAAQAAVTQQQPQQAPAAGPVAGGGQLPSPTAQSRPQPHAMQQQVMGQQQQMQQGGGGGQVGVIHGGRGPTPPHHAAAQQQMIRAAADAAAAAQQHQVAQHQQQQQQQAMKVVQQQQLPQGVTITPKSSSQMPVAAAGGLSPSIQSLQNQFQLQITARQPPQQQVQQQPQQQQVQGHVNPLRQQQVTSSTHPQRPLMRQQSLTQQVSTSQQQQQQQQQQMYQQMRNPSPDQGYTGGYQGGGGYQEMLMQQRKSQQQQVALQQQLQAQQRMAAYQAQYQRPAPTDTTDVWVLSGAQWEAVQDPSSLVAARLQGVALANAPTRHDSQTP